VKGQPIGFEIEGQTKGSLISNTTLDRFGVFAFSHPTGGFDPALSKPDFFYNLSVEKSGAKWLYNPITYWPPTGSISFFAYAPHSSTTGGAITHSSQSDVGFPIITYTLPDAIPNQIDLLTSIPVYEARNQATPVEFELYHALSTINFRAHFAATMPAGWNGYITEITIGPFKNSGSYNYLNWTIAPSAQDKSYNLSTANGYLQDIQTLSTTPQTITSPNGDLLLIPQSIDANAKITIKFTLDKVGTLENKTVVHTVRNFIPTLEKSKSYTITLGITTEMNFSLKCDVVDWTTYNISLPAYD